MLQSDWYQWWNGSCSDTGRILYGWKRISANQNQKLEWTFVYINTWTHTGTLLLLTIIQIICTYPSVKKLHFHLNVSVMHVYWKTRHCKIDADHTEPIQLHNATLLSINNPLCSWPVMNSRNQEPGSASHVLNQQCLQGLYFNQIHFKIDLVDSWGIKYQYIVQQKCEIHDNVAFISVHGQKDDGKLAPMSQTSLSEGKLLCMTRWFCHSRLQIILFKWIWFSIFRAKPVSSINLFRNFFPSHPFPFVLQIITS